MQMEEAAFKARPANSGMPKCPHCGRPLKKATSPIGHTTIYPFIPCDCAESRAAYEAMEHEKEEEEARSAAERHEKRLDAAGIPKRFRGLSLDVRQYVKTIKDRRSLILSGNIGTGKTSLACAVAEAMIDKKSVRFTTISNINASLFDKEVSESALFRSLSDADLLVLDDLDKGKLGEWSACHIYRVINQRYEDCKPIVVTMNCSMSELTRKLTVKGDATTAKAIVSRLYEMSGGSIINYCGGDKRVAKYG